MNDKFDLAKWLAGEMTDEERKAFEASAEYADYARIRDISARLNAPEFNEQEQYLALRERRERHHQTIPLYRRAWIRAAAAIIVLLGLGAVFNATLPVTREAAAGESFAFFLPDHSEVLLNAGSEARFKKWNWDNSRVVALKGEAFFKVAKGKKFEIQTSLGTVAVLGTHFNVKVREGRLDVTCYEGRVQVSTDGGVKILTAGEAVAFADHQLMDLEQTREATPSWMNNRLQFERETLARIIAELERQYKVSIELQGSQTQLFTGTLPRQNLDGALNVIGTTYHLDVIKKGDRIILQPMNEPR